MADELLAGLDPEQRAVAECLRGPVAVLAGAGTGKTRTLTHRIAYGVRSGVYLPKHVLAVTFTRKAAGELQSRLEHLGAHGVRARTFHSAALAQLGYFWPQLAGGSAPKVINGKVPVISQAAESLGLRLPGETLRDIAAEIEWRKVSMLELEDYAARFTQTPSPRLVPSDLTLEQLLNIQQRYSEILAERRQIDFEDVLILTTGMFQSEQRAATQLREQYRYFMVDEYQDLSPLQHALLRVWLGDREDLCVVGDASQTIYTFAGASSTFLLRFGREFPGAAQFKLERNYRSRGEIVHAANQLMRDRPGALTLRAEREHAALDRAADSPVRQRAKSGTAVPGAVIAAEWFADEHDEAAAVAHAIQTRLRAGLAASDIAVLYRANAQAAPVEAALHKLGIPTQVHGAQRFFDRADVKEAIFYLRGDAIAADSRPLFQAVSDVLRSRGWTAQPPRGAAAREKWEVLNAILSLVDECPAGMTMRAFTDELLRRSRTQHEPTVNAVTLSAIHAAKGLEWPLVHLIGMSEGLLPSMYVQNAEMLEEERRLCYVAITRARDELRISGSGGGARGGRLPSRFLAEAGVRIGS